MCTYTLTHTDFLLFEEIFTQELSPLNLDPQLAQSLFRECIILFCFRFSSFHTYYNLFNIIYIFFLFIKLLE